MAVSSGAFPYLNLFQVVDFRQVKRGSAHRTHSNRSARIIEPAVNEIRIPISIPKDATTTDSFALMKRQSVYRFRFFEHEPTHG